MDCNNGIGDVQDIADGTSLDCRPDGTPDECQLVDNDCNDDGASVVGALALVLRLRYAQRDWRALYMTVRDSATESPQAASRRLEPAAQRVALSRTVIKEELGDARCIDAVHPFNLRAS